MASEPAKTDIQAIFKRLRSNPTNKQCFDCGAKNPTWASVTYGVFLCIDCSAVHRSLGVHLTFIRSTQLDTSWTWLQLRAMQLGSNANAMAFFRQHGCTTSDSQQKYNSRAATMYREKLHSMAHRAMQIHGTKLHLDSSVDPSSPEVKEVDFFEEHEEAEPAVQELTPNPTGSTLSQPVPIANGNGSLKKEPEVDGAPNVEAALSMSPTEAVKVSEPRKSTIGARKPTGAKKGLGGKKGLGAQKVRTNFKAIESEAEQRDKNREMMAVNVAAEQAKTEEDNTRRLASMKLAYKDLGAEEKKRAEQMKRMDPKKREQMERLGMGFGGARGVSHSVMSDMQTIDQETPVQSRNTFDDRYSSRSGGGRNIEDDFEILGGGLHSGPPKYDDSPFSSSSKRKDDLGWPGSNSSSNGKRDWDMDSKSSVIEEIPSRKPDEDKGRSRKAFDAGDGSEAQKKFGNAKAISSDAFFGKYDADFETKQTLTKFEGQQSISSADFYGGGPSGRSYSNNDNYYNTGPDLQEIRDGVKHGVTKVAGKLSNLANGLVNSIQDHYG